MGENNDEPNPPLWPDSVKLVKPTDSVETIRAMFSETQDAWNEEYQTFTSDFHFSSRRNAILFAPGEYHGLDLQVGYYTQVLGLGTSPEHVHFVNCEHGIYVAALNKHLHEHGTCLDAFWRGAENFASSATNGMQWAVSQAAPLRRVHVHGNLHLFDGGAYASGGHLANSRIDGKTLAGGQQQFLYRNVNLGQGASGGAWSMVFVGSTGQFPSATIGNDTSPSITLLEEPKIRIEKPYVALKDDGTTFELRVPLPVFSAQDGATTTLSTMGPMTDGSHEESRDFVRVRVVRADEPVSRIQEALDQGKDVILAAGIFELEKTLQIRHENQVLLGIGLATLAAPNDGSPCIHVESGVGGVRIAGIMLEATERPFQETTGENETQAESYSTLLEWGEAGVQDSGQSENSGALFDVFCRVGGATLGDRRAIHVDAMMRIHSDNIFGDNLWLWRADHAELRENETANYPHISPIYWQVEQDEFRVETGFEIHGNDVTIFGLAVEHANGHQTVWSGNRGTVAFYQTEFPYDVSQETFGEKEFRGYVVGNNVTEHELHAPGLYSNFRNECVVVKTAVVHPESDAIHVVNPFTVRLDNHVGIKTIVNGKGDFAAVQGRPMRMTKDDVMPNTND